MAALTALCSCATLVNGTTGHVRVSTTPSGAEVFLGEHKLGETPCVVSMRHDEREWLRFVHPTVEHDRYAQAARSGSGWIVLSFLTGAFVFPIIDGFTGAASPLRHEMHVDLDKASTEDEQTRSDRLRATWGGRPDELPWN